MSTDRGSVELTGVTKRFGAMTAVDRLDLEVEAGEFISLLGPSGCGKTTTLRMLAGFEQPGALHDDQRLFAAEQKPRSHAPGFSFAADAD